MAEKLENFSKILKKFNTRNTEDQPQPADVKEMLKVLLSEDQEIDSFFQQMFQFGGAMYLLGVHNSAIKALVSNSEFYAENSLETFCKELKDFKGDPTIKGLKAMLTAGCCSSSSIPSTSGASGRPPKRNLLQFLESDEEEEEDVQQPERQHSSKSKKRSRQSTSQ